MAKKPQKSKVHSNRMKGMPFDAERRAKVIEKVREGASTIHACHLAGVGTTTVKRWLASGRSDNPSHPEHVRFAREFDACVSEGVLEAVKSLREQSKSTEYGTRATLALLAATDERFGDRALRRRRARADCLRAEEDARAARFRADIAEALANKAKEQGQEIAFGLNAILASEVLSESTRREVAEWAVKMGYVLVRSADLTGSDGRDPSAG